MTKTFVIDFFDLDIINKYKKFFTNNTLKLKELLKELNIRNIELYLKNFTSINIDFKTKTGLVVDEINLNFINIDNIFINKANFLNIKLKNVKNCKVQNSKNIKLKGIVDKLQIFNSQHINIKNLNSNFLFLKNNSIFIVITNSEFKKIFAINNKDIYFNNNNNIDTLLLKNNFNLLLSKSTINKAILSNIELDTAILDCYFNYLILNKITFITNCTVEVKNYLKFSNLDIKHFQQVFLKNNLINCKIKIKNSHIGMKIINNNNIVTNINNIIDNIKLENGKFSFYVNNEEDKYNFYRDYFILFLKKNNFTKENIQIFFEKYLNIFIKKPEYFNLKGIKIFSRLLKRNYVYNLNKI